MDNPISFRDLFADDLSGGIGGLIAQVEQMKKSLLSMLQEVKAEAAAVGNALSGTSSSSKPDRDATAQYAAQIQQLMEANTRLQKSVTTLESQLASLRKTQASGAQSSISLSQAYQSLDELIRETGVDVNSLLTSQRQLTIADKNGVTANSALEGSYNKLYAQYNLIKNVLNAMGAEMRNNTTIGGKWEAQAASLMATMKQMQEATGKHTLSVGDYTKAFNGLSLSTQQIIRELPSLANSASQFFIAISNNVPIFTDAFKRVREETGSFKTALFGTLKSVFSWQTALIGVLTVLPGLARAIHNKRKAQEEDNEVTKQAIKLQKELSEEYFETYKAIEKSLSRTRTLYNVARDEENRTLADRIKAANALKKLHAEELKNITAEQIATGEADAAVQKLIDTLAARSEAEENISKIEKLEQAMADLNHERQKADEELTKSGQKRNAQLKIYNELLHEGKTDAANAFYLTNIKAVEEQMAAYRKQIAEADAALDDTNKKIQEIRNYLPAEGLDYEIINTGKEKEKLDKLKDYYWEYVESKARLLEDDKDRELALSNISYEQKIAEMRKVLEEYKATGQLTIDNEKYINGIIENLTRESAQKRGEIIRKYYQEAVPEESIDDYSISALYSKSLAENANALLASRTRLNKALEDGTYKEAKTEGQTYKQLLIEKLQLEEQLQEALLKMRYDTGELTQTQYETELANLQTALDKNIAKVQKGRRSKFDIWTLLFGKTQKDGYGNVYKELSAEAQTFISAFQNSMKQAFDYMDEWMDKRIEMAEVAVEAAEKESEAAKTALDYEMEARANGYANNVDLARREYEEKLKLEQDAIAEKERLEKIQEAINSAAQVSSLLSATANLWASYSALPGIGQALALAAIATMWGSFAAAKITAAQMTATKYGEGGVEYLNYGGSHASGNDIDFGRDKDGRPRRVERGEIIGVINKRNVEKYGVSKVTDVIRSLNKGTFEEKYGVSKVTDVIRNDSVRQSLLQESILRSIGLNRQSNVIESLEQSHFSDKYGLAFSGFEGRDTDLTAVERGIRRLIEQGETRVVSTPNGRIEYKGNNKRIIKTS